MPANFYTNSILTNIFDFKNEFISACQVDFSILNKITYYSGNTRLEKHKKKFGYLNKKLNTRYFFTKFL